MKSHLIDLGGFFNRIGMIRHPRLLSISKRRRHMYVYNENINLKPAQKS